MEPQKKKAVIFPSPSIPQLDKTDGIIAVKPTVFNSILEVGELTSATTTSQAMSTTTTSCRIARPVAHAWKQAARHRKVLPLNARSSETLLHDYNTVNQQFWTSTTTYTTTTTTQPRMPPIMSWLSSNRTFFFFLLLCWVVVGVAAFFHTNTPARIFVCGLGRAMRLSHDRVAVEREIHGRIGTGAKSTNCGASNAAYRG